MWWWWRWVPWWWWWWWWWWVSGAQWGQELFYGVHAFDVVFVSPWPSRARFPVWLRAVLCAAPTTPSEISVKISAISQYTSTPRQFGSASIHGQRHTPLLHRARNGLVWVARKQTILANPRRPGAEPELDDEEQNRLSDGLQLWVFFFLSAGSVFRFLICARIC